MATKEPAESGNDIFQHQPLDHNKSTMRLLTVLQERSPEGYVQCTISHASTDEMNGAYTCLSYVWRTESSKPGLYYIMINGKRMGVLHNLYEFLRVACEKCPGEPLWIDAVCIDQRNVAERNHQVSEMGRIYSRAKRVIVWLGPSETTDINTLTYLRAAINDPWNRALLPENLLRARFDRHHEKIEEYRDFFGTANTYWNRAWITQELALARHVLLIYGTAELDLHLDEEVLLRRVFTTKEETTYGILQIWKLAIDTQWLTPDARQAAYIEEGATREIKTLHQSSNLLKLLTMFPDKECLHSRDQIYSLRSLCTEGESLEIDYEMSPRGLLQHVIHISQQSLCLCSALALTMATKISQDDSIQLEIKLNHSEYRLSPPGSLFWGSCSMCGDYLDRRLTTGRLFCSSRICTGPQVHFSLSRDLNRVQNIQLGNRTAAPDGVTVQEVSDLNAEPCYVARLPISFLVPLGFTQFRAAATEGCDVFKEGRVRFIDTPAD